MLNSPLFRRSSRRAVPLFVTFSFLGSAAFAQAPFRPKTTEHYRPFAITSSKLKTEMPDASIRDKLMCRSTLDNMVEIMELLQNYDLVRTSPMDGSLSLTTFRGSQGGRAVEVSLAVQSADRLLMHVLVDGQVAVTCR